MKSKIRGLIIALTISVSIILGGCTPSGSKDTIDLGVFKTGDIYCYKGLEWGITKKEVEKKIGMTLTEYHPTIPERYVTDEELSLWDIKGTPMFEFIEDKFTSVSFDFSDDENDLQELSNKLLNELVKIYGQYDDELEMKIQSGKGYRWMNYSEDKSLTTLQLHCIGDEKKISRVTLTVAYMDPAEKGAV